LMVLIVTMKRPSLAAQACVCRSTHS